MFDLLDLHPSFGKDLRKIIKKLDDGKGARVEEVTEMAFRCRVFEEYVQAGLLALKDVGDVYEPSIGRYKVVEGAMV